MLIEMCFIELEYICQLTVNPSQKYTSKFTYTDNIMRFCSAIVKLKSGRAVVHLLWPGWRESASTSAQVVKNTHFTWHFQSEDSINDWDNLHDIKPNFILCLSEATIQRIQNARFWTCYILRKAQTLSFASLCRQIEQKRATETT